MTTRTALIVGASRGLGLGLARELAQRGWQVIGTARKPEQATALRSLVEGSNGRVTLEQIDVDSAADLAALVGRLAGRRLDLLLVNAGIGGPAQQSVASLGREDLAKVLWTNAIAPLRIAEALQSRIVEGGTLAFMSSLLGSVADNTSGGHDLYRISKAALNMLTRSFVAGLPEGRALTVLNLHPGWVRTDMGGPAAPLGVEESVCGLVDVLERRHEARHRYVDYQGRELPW